MKTNNITEEQNKITWRRAAVIFADERVWRVNH